ncbi:ketopantoate reductase [Lysinibacillus sp. 2017]|uniref:ketopantoate reductase family protein n=1 Tax=unclassified Lysinibacillus TaxID=2636778 RepID=UPI000D5262FB|nr:MULTISPECIES: 2-dehydropantoate 2-reductase [unclassified Lysinibacillus]AWE06572.1 ketopantoate reductase [Lysinibacillus sp. 2017]TGN35391.1 2-dehydropantoate 2-reductase [Lysinibacillus sp. S2017]
MQIEIIGAGAVGLLLASFYAENGAEVRLITRAKNKQEKYIQIKRTNTDATTQFFQVEEASTIRQDTDLVIIAVKYGQLQQVYEQLKTIRSTIPLLFVQNGIAHFEEAMQLEQQNIAFSSVQFGAQKLDVHHVAHKGMGLMKIAVGKGELSKFSIVKSFSSDLLPILFELDAEAMLMEKALLNSFINPLTAILRVKNGQLIEQNNAFQLLKSLYNEIIDTFPQYADTFQFEQVVGLCEKTSQNTSSMLADIQAGRKTEIDTIVGAILKKAHIQNKQMPMLQTLYMLVKAFEESGETM